MFFKGAAVTVIVLAGTAGVWAEAPASQPASQPQSANQDSDRIAGLIAEMGTGQFHARAAAQKELVNIGLPAEPALRDAEAHSANAEIRARAKSAFDQIEDNRPDTPSFISITATRANPATVLGEIAEQAKFKISVWPPYMWSGENGQPIPKVSLSLDRAPYCVALEQFCKATKSVPWAFGNEMQIQQGNGGVWDQEDRVAFIATQIVHTRTVELGTGQTTGTDNIQMLICFDPKLHVQGHQFPRVTVATDENGVSLLPPGGAQREDFFFQSQDPWVMNGNLMLSHPEHLGKRLARLEGTIAIRVATQTAHLEIPDLGKAGGPSGEAEHRKVEVLDFNMGDTGGSLHVKITKTTPQGLFSRFHHHDEDQEGNIFQEFQSARVSDSTGKVVQFEGTSGGGSNDDADLQCRLSRQGGPFKPPFSLQWDFTTQMNTITVPFKFHDLPMPPE